MLHFASTSDLSSWRGSDRSFSVDFNTGNWLHPAAWDGEELADDLTSSTEGSVDTSSNYIIYYWSDLGLSDSDSDDLADKGCISGGEIVKHLINVNTVLDINNLG